MVTASTYRHVPFFNSAEKLDLLHTMLFQIFQEYDVRLQAWAIFPNHYHFIALLKDATQLSPAIRRLHSKAALAVNAIDHAAGRRVFYQYWDSHTKQQRTFFARLHYVHANAVHHGIVKQPENYRWCSAAWFERNASPAFRKTVYGYPIDLLKVKDDFIVEAVE